MLLILLLFHTYHSCPVRGCRSHGKPSIKAPLSFLSCCQAAQQIKVLRLLLGWSCPSFLPASVTGRGLPTHCAAEYSRWGVCSSADTTLPPGSSRKLRQSVPAQALTLYLQLMQFQALVNISSVSYAKNSKVE